MMNSSTKNREADILVSVIIPVFNGEKYLRASIESVLAQSIDDYELIVVDDGSTDGSPEIALTYGSRVSYVRKPNGGVASALNLGIREAKGRYISWLSHDDMFLPDKLEKQLAFLMQFKEYKACYTDYQIIDGAGNVIRTVQTPWYPKPDVFRALFAGMYINGSSMLIERTVFRKVGFFDESRLYSQDSDMWFRMLRHFDIGRVPEALLQWRSHPTQGSRSTEVFLRDAQVMYRSAFETLGIATFFPHLADRADDPKTVAWANTWLGDTMAAYRSWFGFAAEQYRRSLEIWPSIRNPARLKMLINRLRPIRRAIAFRILRMIGRLPGEA
jgi:glycosyltransferase involved in cell wall biosynthesis